MGWRLVGKNVAFAVEKGAVANFTNYDTAATRGFVFEVGASSMASETNMGYK